jgi:ribosome-binding protein aMBF1 (putative translation factor)
MPLAAEAQREYKQADLDALKMRFRARARLGKVVLEERRAKGWTQDQAADDLGVVVEQVRRYERSYRDWLKEYPDEPLG